MLYGALLPIQAIRFKLTLYLLFYVFYVLCMSHFIVCFLYPACYAMLSYAINAFIHSFYPGIQPVVCMNVQH